MRCSSPAGDAEQLDAIAAEVKIPLMMGGGRADLQDKDYFASRGVRIALQGHQPFSAAVQAVYNTLKALREGTKPVGAAGRRVGGDDGARHARGDYKSWTEKFSGGLTLPQPSPAPRARGRSPARGRGSGCAAYTGMAIRLAFGISRARSRTAA